MSSIRVSLELPLTIHRQLTQIAEASAWSFEKVLLRTIRSGMPPSLSKVPLEFHDDLISLNRLDDRDLMRIADGEWPAPKRKSALHKAADFDALRRTYALSLLKWRGHPVQPSFEW
ncbi:MAG: hypothetical protein ACE5E7_02355 [Anaerolineae bacterium]